MTLDDNETLLRRARFRELIEHCFENKQSLLGEHIRARTGKEANSGEFSTLKQDNGPRRFGDKKARALCEQIGLHRQWFAMPLGTNPGVATAAFAFDLFIFNYDHHHNNWSFHDQNGNTTARMFDYSKALWTLARSLDNLPAPSSMKLLPPANERTCVTYKEIRKWIGGEDFVAAGKVLALLKQIGPRWVETQIKSFPATWMDDTTLGSTLTWWDSQSRLDRIQQIEEGLKNGTLF